jgi:hypothetical protein
MCAIDEVDRGLKFIAAHVWLAGFKWTVKACNCDSTIITILLIIYDIFCGYGKPRLIVNTMILASWDLVLLIYRGYKSSQVNVVDGCRHSFYIRILKDNYLYSYSIKRFL